MMLPGIARGDDRGNLEESLTKKRIVCSKTIKASLGGLKMEDNGQGNDKSQSNTIHYRNPQRSDASTPGHLRVKKNFTIRAVGDEAQGRFCWTDIAVIFMVT